MNDYPDLSQYGRHTAPAEAAPEPAVEPSSSGETRAAEELLRETLRHITGPRNAAYGPPTSNFTDTAELWNVLFGDLLRSDRRFTADHVALAMGALKMARIKHDSSESSRDSWGDLAGYAALGYECVVAQ